jgi:hypothetical protein
MAVAPRHRAFILRKPQQGMCHNSTVESAGRKTVLNRITIAAILLGLQVAIAVADGPPKLDVTATCKAAADYSISPGRDKDSCMGDEDTAKGALVQNWSKYSATDKTQCIGTVTTGGPPSYVELLSCLEIMRDAKDIREGDAQQPDRPAHSTPRATPYRRR